MSRAQITFAASMLRVVIDPFVIQIVPGAVTDDDDVLPR